MPEQTVKVPLTEYTNLLRAQAELQALRAGGVDNWEGYAHSLRVLHNSDEYGNDDDGFDD